MEWGLRRDRRRPGLSTTLLCVLRPSVPLSGPPEQLWSLATFKHLQAITMEKQGREDSLRSFGAGVEGVEGGEPGVWEGPAWCPSLRAPRSPKQEGLASSRRAHQDMTGSLRRDRTCPRSLNPTAGRVRVQLRAVVR